MSEGNNLIRSGPFKGKKIELAFTVGVSAFATIADEFMSRVFGYEHGDYLITDESSLRDFTGVGDMELQDIHQRIRDEYQLDVSDLTDKLIDIFVRISERYDSRPNGS